MYFNPSAKIVKLKFPGSQQHAQPPTKLTVK